MMAREQASRGTLHSDQSDVINRFVTDGDTNRFVTEGDIRRFVAEGDIRAVLTPTSRRSVTLGDVVFGGWCGRDRVAVPGDAARISAMSRWPSRVAPVGDVGTASRVVPVGEVGTVFQGGAAGDADDPDAGFLSGIGSTLVVSYRGTSAIHRPRK